MKISKILCGIMIITVMLCFSGCPSNVSEQPADSSDTWEYTEENPVYELSYDVDSLTITGLPDGNCAGYLVFTNPSDTEEYSRYVSDVAITSEDDAANDDTSASGNIRSVKIGNVPEGIQENIPDADFTEHTRVFDFKPLEMNLSRGRAVTIATLDDDLPETYYTSVGDTENLTVLSSYTDSTYESVSATIRYASDTVNVWVLADDYNATGDAGITDTQAEAIGEKMESLYDDETNIFGTPSNHLIWSSTSLAEMSTASPTKDKLNIVLGDIGEEGSDGVVGGYFSATDYCSNDYLVTYNYSEISNEGKYLYVDSYYLNQEEGSAYSTVVHELQHLINYGVKYIEPLVAGETPTYYSTWYTEMLSMLCEDLMQGETGVSDANSPKGRLALFNLDYPDKGVTDAFSSSDSYLSVSYAVTYAFGAFLARNYGGAALVQEIAQNDAVDIDSIIDAVKTIDGKDVTWKSLLEAFGEALVFNTEMTYSYPTFNQSPDTSVMYDDYTYPLDAIDLWDDFYTYSYTDTDDSSNSYTAPFNGPYLGDCTQYYYLLEPHGVVVTLIGNTDGASKVTLEFNDAGELNQKAYIMIQQEDEKTASTELITEASE